MVFMLDIKNSSLGVLKRDQSGPEKGANVKSPPKRLPVGIRINFFAFGPVHPKWDVRYQHIYLVMN